MPAVGAWMLAGIGTRRSSLLSSVSIGCVATALLALFPSSVRASGIDIGENGALVLGRGGTSVGLLDTAYALQFNPAGMTFGDGLDVRVETIMTNPGVSFQNSGPSAQITNGQSTKVSNLTGLSYGPQLMATYHPKFLHKMLAFGVGVWGPPGVTTFRFNDPRSGWAGMETQSDQATASTPQRYDVIQQHTVIAYPSLGIAVRPIPQLSIGATVQYVVADLSLATSLQGAPPSLAQALAGEPNPDSARNDVVANVSMHGVPRLTGVVGVVVNPIPNLILSGSFRPKLPIYTTGTLEITPGPDVTKLGVMIQPNPSKATLSLNLPPIVRAGAAYKWKRLTSSAEFVWEGWSVNKDFVLTSQDGKINTLLGQQDVGTTVIPNNWQDTYSGRVGFGYDFIQPGELKDFTLQGELGFMYDSNAIPAQWQKVPFVTGNMFGPTVGVSAGWHGVALNMGFAYYIPQTISVSNSSVVKPTAPPPQGIDPGTPPVIGDGTYTTNLWVFAVGLSYHGFGG